MNTRFISRKIHSFLGFAALLASVQIDPGAYGTFDVYDDDFDSLTDRPSHIQGYFYNHLFHRGIHLDGPRRIRFPEISVTEYPQEIYSGERTLRLTNRHYKRGWLLGGKVFREKLFGIHSWSRIPAEFKFKSITWVEGGNGSTAGINIHPNGEYIEADPGFGKGVYDIKFEIALQVPAFPDADRYYGILAFIVQ